MLTSEDLMASSKLCKSLPELEPFIFSKIEKSDDSLSLYLMALFTFPPFKWRKVTKF